MGPFGLGIEQPWAADVTFPVLFAWTVVTAVVMFGLLGWLIYSVGEAAWAMSGFCKAPMKVDLFRRNQLGPIAQWSLGVASIFMGGIALSMVVLPFEARSSVEALVIYGVLFTSALVFFFVTLRDIHRVLYAARLGKQTQAHEKVIETMEAFEDSSRRGNRGEMQALSGEMIGWIAYEKRINEVSTWPFSTAIMRRLLIASIVPVVTIAAKVVPGYSL